MRARHLLARGGTRLTAIGVAAVLACALSGAPAAAADRPLVYVVVLDGLDRGRVDSGRTPFISSLLAGDGANATYFPHSSSVMPAETNPNHTAMMSGAYAGQSGIPSNTFALYEPLADEDSCAATGPFNPRALPTETSGESRTCPEAQMVFEAIGRQGNPGRLGTAAIFGKPKLGRIFGGRNLDPEETDVDYLWAPCDDGAEDDQYCGSVPTNPISGYALDDRTVMNQVLRTIDGGVQFPGGSTRPDLTFVNLHQIDSAGHATGTGVVYDLAIAAADAEIERLVTNLRARGEWDRTVLILLSDHSMDTIARKVSLTDAFTEAGIPESDFVALNNESSIDFIYLADRKSSDRFELLRRMREIALAEPGVAEALYRKPNPLDGGRSHTVDSVHPDWHAAGPRVGDLFVTADPRVGFGEPSPLSNPLPGNHGAVQTQDNFLAVVSGGGLVRHGRVEGAERAAAPVNVDIAPTVMGLFGLFAPRDSEGVFLRKAFDRRELKRSSRPTPPSIRLSRSRVRVFPRGGRYDLEVRAGGSWKTILRNSGHAGVRTKRLSSGRCGVSVRARARSAAGLRSAWTRDIVPPRCSRRGR